MNIKERGVEGADPKPDEVKSWGKITIYLLLLEESLLELLSSES